MFKEWEDRVKKVILLDDLKGHAGIQVILERFIPDIEEMNILLKSAKSKELSDFQRDLVIERKELYEWFVNLFSNLDKETKDIEESVDKEDKHFEENKDKFIK